MIKISSTASWISPFPRIFLNYQNSCLSRFSKARMNLGSKLCVVWDGCFNRSAPFSHGPYLAMHDNCSTITLRSECQWNAQIQVSYLKWHVPCEVPVLTAVHHSQSHSPYLALHVHDDDCVGAVAHDKLLDITWQRVDAVNSDVAARRASQRFERVLALCRLDVPHLDRAVRAGTGATHRYGGVI